MRKIILSLIFTPIFFIALKHNVSAFIIDKDYTRSYELKEEFVQINETKTIKVVQKDWYISQGSQEGFTIFYPIEKDPDKEAKIQKTIESIRITDRFGNSLDFQTEELQSGNIFIKVTFPERIDFNENYIINLNYRSYGLSVKSGKIYDLYIPAFSTSYEFENSEFRENVKTTIKINKLFGDVNFVSPETHVGDDGTSWVIDIPRENLIGETNWIQIGTTQYYSFSIKQPYVATSEFPFYFNTFKIPIPRDIESGPISQKVFFTNISPKPESITTDIDGNLIAEFKVPATEAGEISITGYGILTQDKNFKIENAGLINDFKPELIARNTASAQFWESDVPELKNVALELKGDKTDVFKIVQDTYKYVVDKIDYSNVKRFGINERQGALKTLQGGAAVCMEYSDLFIALMRAQGIPARAGFGYGYSALDYDANEEKTVNHQWAEVYLPALNKWINVDTTWGEEGPELIGGDLNHFYFYVASLGPEQPSSTEVQFFGNLSEIPKKVVTVDTVEELPAGGKDQNTILEENKPISGNSYLHKLEQVLDQIYKFINTKVNDFINKVFPEISNNQRTAVKIGFITFLIVVVFSPLALRFLFRRNKDKTN